MSFGHFVRHLLEMVSGYFSVRNPFKGDFVGAEESLLCGYFCGGGIVFQGLIVAEALFLECFLQPSDDISRF